ncbi:MAG: hypothetical protein ABI045_00075 [Flavobacteriales bacterium]
MDVGLLEAVIIRECNPGNIARAVVATADMTDFGSINPLKKVRRLAAQYELRYYVDAVYRCDLFLKDRYKNLLDGI